MTDAELDEMINSIIDEEVEDKVKDIQEYIDSGDLDKEIAKQQ